MNNNEMKIKRIQKNPTLFNKVFKNKINNIENVEDIEYIMDNFPIIWDMNRREINNDTNFKSCKEFLNAIRKNNINESLIVETLIDFIKNMTPGNVFTQDNVVAILEQISYKIPNWDITSVRTRIKVLLYGMYNVGLVDMDGGQTFKAI